MTLQVLALFTIVGMSIGCYIGMWLEGVTDIDYRAYWYLKGYIDKEMEVPLIQAKLDPRICMVDRKRLIK